MQLRIELIAFCFAFFVLLVRSWNEWDYKVTWTDDPLTSGFTKLGWEEIWLSDNVKFNGNSSAPRARRGHSLHVVKTDLESEYKGDTYLVMFGGRDNNQKAVHIPTTYEVKTVDGVLEFESYDKRPVSPCNDFNNTFYSKAEQEGCGSYESSVQIDVGLIYNDVWAYKLCNATSDPPERYFDTPCVETGWVLWHKGAREGGCSIQLGIEVCTVPSERYNHASVMHADGTMYVYGGFSQRCADYCDDIWFFDIYYKDWRQVYAAGTLTKFERDLARNGRNFRNDPNKVPVDDTTSKFSGPGKRWRHSMVIGEPYYNESSEEWMQPSAVYGGHRLWHGYSPENSEANNWGTYETRPLGGYLDDLWIYTKYLDLETAPGSGFKSNYGLWEKLEPTKKCRPSPGVSWDSRNDETCETIKPVGRASHGSAYDTARQRVWIFGGYTTYYPYLRTDGSGSGPGVTSLGSGGFIPYPGYDYFRNDLWYYDLENRTWVEEVPEEGYPVPDARQDAIFLLLGDLIFMHGGFSDNYIYDDTWYFNITSKRWLQKKEFVNPIYSAKCTDDLVYINNTENNCTHLLWPIHLERDEYFPFDVLPYSQQQYYWPDSEIGPYYGIFEKEFYESGKAAALGDNIDADPVDGTPLFPRAATGPMQYAKPFQHTFNRTHNATLYERCTSVVAEPTRGRLVDGLFGRSNGSVFIPQPRRQRPGWDGCRDRYDGRSDLPAGLQYVMPLPRYGHRAIYHAPTKEIIMYGGLAYKEPQPKALDNTWEATTLSDMWYYHLDHCVNNCTNHGACHFGFCQCNVGYYGNDCSNTSCPGTFCYYDEYTNEQNCTHACQAGYIHQDNDTYVQDIYKKPCTEENWGESNGICDGFGSVQCAPPFLGDDCGTKDCKNNCSFNGWCSIEYPVSRCLCIPGYFGETCEFKLCFNNCSYPNGECNTTSGTCNCNMMYSPYNNTREYHPWGGEDCSYIMAYAAAPLGATVLKWWVLMVVIILVAHLALLQGTVIFPEKDTDAVVEGCVESKLSHDQVAVPDRLFIGDE